MPGALSGAGAISQNINQPRKHTEIIQVPNLGYRARGALLQ